MTKRTCILFCILLICASLSGCSHENHSIESTAHKTHPYITSLMDSFSQSCEEHLPDKLFVETEEYSIYRKSGTCYLSFKSGNQRLSYENGCKECVGHTLLFDSMDELYDWLLSPEFSDKNMSIIQHAFPLDPENGFIIADPENLKTIVLPDEYHIESVGLGGECCWIVFKTNERLPSGRDGGGLLVLNDTKQFEYQLSSFYSFELGEVAYKAKYDDEINNTTTYEYETGWELRRVQQCLQTEEGSRYIEKEFAKGNDDEYHLSSVDIFGYENHTLFTLSSHYSDDEDLIRINEWLKITDYIPPGN